MVRGKSLRSGAEMNTLESDQQSPDLSVVTTMYGSERYLREFYERVRAQADSIAPNTEFVFVNDGSPDGSLAVALQLFQQDGRMRILDLSRNFGHHRAIMTGLAHAKGKLVFLIDCDLEEPPEILALFWQRLSESGADVVFGVQRRRKGGFVERFGGWCFYKLFSWLSDHPVPENFITARLMRKRYVDALVQHQEREVYVGGLFALTGYHQEAVAVDKGAKGSTTYTLARRIAVLVNAVTSFSSRPLVLVFYLGLSITSLMFLCSLVLVAAKLLYIDFELGWPSLIVSIWFLGGLTIFSIGLVGIYVAKVHSETKARPYTIIRNIYEGKRA